MSFRFALGLALLPLGVVGCAAADGAEGEGEEGEGEEGEGEEGEGEEGEGEGEGEAAACLALEVAFDDLGAAEFIQWRVEEGQVDRKSLPAVPGQYIANNSFAVSLADPDIGGSAVLVLNDDLALFPAGTYTCADGDASVNVSFVGAASPETPGSACTITLTANAENGGRLEGEFAMFTGPDAFGAGGGCAHGRFGLTDVE